MLKSPITLPTIVLKAGNQYYIHPLDLGRPFCQVSTSFERGEYNARIGHPIVMDRRLAQRQLQGPLVELVA